MLNEPASTRDDRPVLRSSIPLPTRTDELRGELRDKVASVMLIESETFVETDEQTERHSLMLESQLVGTFEGSLTLDSEAAYDQLDGLLAPGGHLAVFRETQAQKDEIVSPSRRHTIHVLTGRPNPKPRSWWINAVLLVATILSVLFIGTAMADSQAFETQLALNGPLELLRGLPYAISILLILGSHELGHYFAARHHKLAVTLPYFIPMPFTQLGTMGAFIQLRQPMKNRNMLFDVGAAGPLVGLIFAVPILFIGLATSRPMPIFTPDMPPDSVLVYEGDSLLYAGAKFIMYGRYVPDGYTDVRIDENQLLWAGWAGLLVTALNLIPIGQLDGGHVLYSLIGERARRLYLPAMAIMVGLVFIADVWLFWVILLLLFGRLYATPLDMITPLSKRRRWLAVMTLVIFVLIFVPAPLSQQIHPAQPLNLPRDSALLVPGIALVLSKFRR